MMLVMMMMVIMVIHGIDDDALVMMMMIMHGIDDDVSDDNAWNWWCIGGDYDDSNGRSD